MDITAWVAVARAEVSPEKVAGVDPGIIHPLAVAAGDQALLISGRAVRAEEFLHLEDQKARQRKMATKRAPSGPRRDKLARPDPGVGSNWPGPNAGPRPGTAGW